jgi:alkylation response protein AidB-like acyl-CoA dehydrogenase
MNLLDKHWFNEVVFEDVRVPITERIGGEGEGWRLLASALGVERITIYRAYVHWRTLLGAVRWAKRNGWSDSVYRQKFAQLRVEYEIAELLLQRAVQLHTEGVDYRGQAAMVKLFNTEFAQRLHETNLNLLGLYGPLMEADPRAPYGGATSHNFLSAVQDTIGAGTSEVQRDLIAIRALGLPRG